MRSLRAGFVLVGLAVAQLENAYVGLIDFYALGDLDPKQLRAALTVRPGDKFSWPATRDRLRDELAKAAGRPYTHFSPVCCDKDGRWTIYIGFGQKQAAPAFRPKPTADVQLEPELTKLYDEFMAMLPASLKHAAGKADDYSKGYSLSSYPPMRAIQMRMRHSGLAHEDEILQVLSEAAEDKQRSAAALLAGYTRQSPRQIAALTDASRDPNDTVRNNATRSLGVLADTPEFARQIPAAPFIEKLNSPVWSDRNKGLMLLTRLTRDRNAELLAELKARALPALIEMAQWQNPGHASGPILLLGRIAGINAAELDELAEKGDAARVLAAVKRLD